MEDKGAGVFENQAYAQKSSYPQKSLWKYLKTCR
jgi:hypothetical protein